MQRTIWICDYCHQEIKGELTQAFGYDLCEECTQTIQTAVNDIINNTATADYSTAQALRDAGWSVKDIAKELRVPPKNIYNHTTTPKKRKKYENEFNEKEPAIMKSPELV